MLDNTSAAQVLRACGVDTEDLRKPLPNHHSQPPLHRQCGCGYPADHRFSACHPARDIACAIRHKKEVSGANILAALFGEKDSHAVHFLTERGVNRLDVVNHIVHGVSNDAQSAGATPAQVGAERNSQPPTRSAEKYTIDLNAQALAEKLIR